MASYHILMACAAMLALLASYSTPRAVAWIAALTISFVVSALYIYMPKPDQLSWLLPSGMTALCDMLVIIVMREFARERWESWALIPLMKVSAAISLVYMTGVVFAGSAINILGYTVNIVLPSQNDYGIALEAINYIALVIIGGTGIVNYIGTKDGATIFNRFVPTIRVLDTTIRKEAEPNRTFHKWS